MSGMTQDELKAFVSALQRCRMSTVIRARVDHTKDENVPTSKPRSTRAAQTKRLVDDLLAGL